MHIQRGSIIQAVCETKGTSLRLRDAQSVQCVPAHSKDGRDAHGQPTQKTPTQTKAVCANSSQTLSACCLLILRKKGTVCINCSELVCANCVFIWMGASLGCVHLHDLRDYLSTNWPNVGCLGQFWTHQHSENRDPSGRPLQHPPLFQALRLT